MTIFANCREQDRADRWQKFVQWQIALGLLVFLLANAVVLWLIHDIWREQISAPAVAGTSPPPPIVTEAVVSRLITATSAQLGALALGVGLALNRTGRR